MALLQMRIALLRYTHALSARSPLMLLAGNQPAQSRGPERRRSHLQVSRGAGPSGIEGASWPAAPLTALLGQGVPRAGPGHEGPRATAMGPRPGTDRYRVGADTPNGGSDREPVRRHDSSRTVPDASGTAQLRVGVLDRPRPPARCDGERFEPEQPAQVHAPAGQRPTGRRPAPSACGPRRAGPEEPVPGPPGSSSKAGGTVPRPRTLRRGPRRPSAPTGRRGRLRELPEDHPAAEPAVAAVAVVKGVAVHHDFRVPFRPVWYEDLGVISTFLVRFTGGRARRTIPAGAVLTVLPPVTGPRPCGHRRYGRAGLTPPSWPRWPARRPARA